MQLQPESFREISCVVLGGLMGALIGLPLIGERDVTSAALIAGLSIAVGVAVGFRRRKSVVFFYFCIGGILALSSIISFSMIRD